MTEEDVVQGVVIGVVIVTLIAAMLIFGVESPSSRSAEQAKLDTLYEAMVGDSNSIRSGLQDVTAALHELCHELSTAQGIDPEYCDQ